MVSKNKIMIIAPFWGNPSNVGVYRVDRFIRWLSDAGIEIILVRAGMKDGAMKTAWGTEIMVRDPLRLYRGVSGDNSIPAPPRKPNRLRRKVAYILFNPDPTVVWAKRVARNAEVIKHGQGVRWILSSSPPESVHVVSYLLSRRLGAELLIDMRDGWLDEPLKPLLMDSRIRQWIEGRMEKRILERANRIFVTSEVWKELLQRRIPFVAKRITILTNAYPNAFPLYANRQSGRNSDHLALLHTGRFTGSRSSQKVSHLLRPLFSGIKISSSAGKIILLGQLMEEDLDEVRDWQGRFEFLSWYIEVKNAVSREEMFRMIEQADGLLMLSASNAAVPSKFFEYIPTGKPILAATPKDSAVWKMSEDIPQVLTLDYRETGEDSSNRDVDEFLRLCRQKKIITNIPDKYSEGYLSNIFLEKIRV